MRLAVDENLRGINAFAFEDVIAHRRFDQNRQVSTGCYGDGQFWYLDIQDFPVAGVAKQPRRAFRYIIMFFLGAGG